MQDLTLQDFCSVRLVSQSANALVSKGDILRQWMFDNVDERQIHLCPPASPPTFMYVLEQQRRLSIARRLAVVYADYIEHEILRYTLRRRFPSMSDSQHRAAFQPVWDMMRDKLVPLLLLLQDYLERCRDLLLNLAEADQSPSKLLERFRLGEQHIMQKYDPKSVLIAHKFFLFFSWVNRQILNRPSYIGSFERAVRGWKDGLEHNDFRLCLIFGNIAFIERLLRLNSFKERCKGVAAEISDFDPERCINWRKKWAVTSLSHGQCPPKEQVTTLLKLRLEDTDIWTNSARTLLLSNRLLESKLDLTIGTSLQCVEFLCELSGYDVLHTLPGASGTTTQHIYYGDDYA